MKKLLSIAFFPLLIYGCVTPSEQLEKQSPNENSLESSLKIAKVVEYFDFGCGHCREAAKVMDNLEKKFGYNVQVEHRHFPLNPRTFKVAEASECAREQGKFREFHDEVFANFGKYEKEQILGYAQKVGLQEEVFTDCWNSGKTRSVIQAHQKEASSLGVSGTPFFYINERIKIPGALPESSFQQIIEEVLAE